MAEVVISPRYRHLLPELRNPGREALARLVIGSTDAAHEFSEGTAEYRDDDRRTRMLILRDPALGYYLQYLGPGGVHDPDDIWLSLGDRNRLSEVVCPDDCEVSAGLFVPPPAALEAIWHFCGTGERSPAAEWISHREIPAEGNW